MQLAGHNCINAALCKSNPLNPAEGGSRVVRIEDSVKTYKNIFARICAYNNLYFAWRAAARGKRRSPEVAAFEYALTDNLLQLEEELRQGRYRPGPYRHFRITYPKPRRISAAPFRDRVAHHALVRQIEPIFEARFISDSYACRVGKGTHAALDRCQAFARRYRYVLQCDVVQFFPAVDHTILRAILFRSIADERARWLINLILDSGAGVLRDEYDVVYFPGDDLLAATRPRGLPIGNLTSQFWANCYLNELDQFVKRQLKCPAYLRYVDDSLLFSDSKRQLWTWKRAIVDFLPRLRVTLHDRSSTVYPVSNGIPFLGFVTYPSHRLLKRRNGAAFARRFRRQLQQLAAGELDYADVEASVRGWLAHAAHGDTYGLRRALVSDQLIPRRPN
jgi:RNA-directed DNA polymerase